MVPQDLLEELKDRRLDIFQKWKVELSWRGTRYKTMDPDNGLETRVSGMLSGGDSS